MYGLNIFLIFLLKSISLIAFKVKQTKAETAFVCPWPLTNLCKFL